VSTGSLPLFHTLTAALAVSLASLFGVIRVADVGILDNEVLITCYLGKCGSGDVSLLPHYPSSMPAGIYWVAKPEGFLIGGWSYIKPDFPHKSVEPRGAVEQLPESFGECSESVCFDIFRARLREAGPDLRLAGWKW
jgi:hypothetical protein